MKRDDVLDFFTQLDRLPKGDRTALKREAGTMLHEAGGRAIQAFYKCMLPTIPERYDDRFFAVACLHCLWSEDTKKLQNGANFLSAGEGYANFCQHRASADGNFGPDLGGRWIPAGKIGSAHQAGQIEELCSRLRGPAHRPDLLERAETNRAAPMGAFPLHETTARKCRHKGRRVSHAL